MNFTPRFVIEDDDPVLLQRFTAYIRKVADYARLEYLRKMDSKVEEVPLNQHMADTLGYEDPPSASDNFDFTEDKLADAFNSLDILRRRILTLTFVEGLTAQETADKLGCTVDYVYLQKHRALKKLRDQLMEGGGECGK